MKPKLIFTERALPLILKAFGMSIDRYGFVTTPSGERIKANKIIGFQKNIGIIVEK